jgi:LmbE family N-acetylglucosaminyl deacetylase
MREGRGKHQHLAWLPLRSAGRRLGLALASIGLLAGCAQAPRALSRTALPPLEIAAGERLLVISPHPDDEVIGCGGLIRRVHESGGRVDIVYVTQGDGYLEGVVLETRQLHPKPETFVEYGEWRRRETLGVLTLLRLPEESAHFLGFPDGGLRALWEGRPPGMRALYRSPTTAADRVPYPESEDPGAPYTAARLGSTLRRLIDELHPTLIAIPDPRDQHGDHSAAGLFTIDALHSYLEEARRPRPRVLTYLVHWPGWPGLSSEPPPPLLPPADLTEAPIEWHRLDLTPAEAADKLHVLHVYKTQMDIMGPFLDRFYRRNELFGVFLDDPPPEARELAPLAYRRPAPAR